ncbi:hypothetical protein ASD76_11035 [Altererythrobacter sp. Root672]|nr:hypothetical protein ASD76_11035 [Altererythrobacter sp. Root672]
MVLGWGPFSGEAQAQVTTPQQANGVTVSLDQPVQIDTAVTGAAGYGLHALNGGVITNGANSIDLNAQNSRAIVAESGGQIRLDGTGGTLEIDSQNQASVDSLSTVLATGNGSLVDLTDATITASSAGTSGFSAAEAAFGGTLRLTDSTVTALGGAQTVSERGPQAILVAGEGSKAELNNVTVFTTTTMNRVGSAGILAGQGGDVVGRDIDINIVAVGDLGNKIGVQALDENSTIVIDNLDIEATNGGAPGANASGVQATTRSDITINSGNIYGNAMNAGLSSNIGARLTANDVHVTSTKTSPISGLVNASNGGNLTMVGGSAKYSSALESVVGTAAGLNSELNLRGTEVFLGHGSVTAAGGIAVQALNRATVNLDNAIVTAESLASTRVTGLSATGASTLTMTNGSVLNVKGGANANTSLKNPGDNYSVGGRVGVRFKW